MRFHHKFTSAVFFTLVAGCSGTERGVGEEDRAAPPVAVHDVAGGDASPEVSDVRGPWVSDGASAPAPSSDEEAGPVVVDGGTSDSSPVHPPFSGPPAPWVKPLVRSLEEDFGDDAITMLAGLADTINEALQSGSSGGFKFPAAIDPAQHVWHVSISDVHRVELGTFYPTGELSSGVYGFYAGKGWDSSTNRDVFKYLHSWGGPADWSPKRRPQLTLYTHLGAN